jgi:ATP-dependent helicase/nuclease subunit B
VDSTRLTLCRDDGGGIRVLDALRLRGCTFRHVHLLGLNAGLFPRPPREDPVLPDWLRRALRERTGRPLVVESEAADEEHLLLATLLGSASERVELSWQRADESGRAKVASLALREVGRIALGASDVERVKREALHLPSHPEQWIRTLAEGTGLLDPGEQMLLAALHSRAADAATKLGRRFPELVPGLEMLRATQSFTPADDAYDGRIGPVERDKPLSVTEIEVLGRCPLQYFFRSVLRIGALGEPASPFGLAPNELGTRVHELLEQLYRALGDAGLFDGGDPAALRRRGRELLEGRRATVFGETGSRLARRLPRLWERLGAAWFEALRRFVEDDLMRIGEAELRPLTFEKLVCETVDLGRGCDVTVRGKFDRLLQGPRGRLVGDYKTSRKLDWRVNPTNMLKAATLQVPLYQLLAGPDAAVELLGVHPDLDPTEDGARYVFAGFDDAEVARSFAQTLRVLLGLARDGRYPFQKGDHCEWCDFRKACRRDDPPSQERERQHADAAAFRDLQMKSRKSPHGR